VPDPSLLILIPAYNEEARIEPVLREYAQFFQAHYSGKTQILVVLNGCTDDTLGVVRRVAADYFSVSALEFREAIGKGGALIEGLKLAPLADLIGYADADGATSPAAFMELVKRIGEADCVIGSRWLPESVMHQEQPTLRRVASRTFHFIVELLFWMHIQDTQCPCKLMRRAAVQKIHPTLCIAQARRFQNP
jgi:glycosyltransferase involved in cell wall biosynthesis